MDRHRTRFLASLSARLKQERALRESQAEPPPIWRRPAGQSDPAREPIPAEIPPAPAEIPKATGPLLDSPAPDDRTSPAQIIVTPRSPGRRAPRDEALKTSEPEQTSIAAVPWSETGMPRALRDAIASVRRVSHEMDEPPPRRGLAWYRPPPDHDLADEHTSFDRAAADNPPFDQHVLHEEPPFDAGMAAERFGDQGLHEEPPLLGYMPEAQEPSDDSAAVGERHAFNRGWQDERASPDEPAWHEEQPFDDGADAPLPFGDRGSRKAPSFDDRADASLLFGDDAADEQSADDDGHERSKQVIRQAPQGRPPLWREVPRRRRLNVAALAIATLCVVLAGFGLGILSSAREIDRWVASLGLTPLADAMVGDTRTEPAPSTSPAPSSGGVARPAEPSQLSELETVRVAPLPAPPGMEQSAEPTTSAMPLPPPPRVEQSPEPTTSAMPLPPPPKPALRSSLSGDEAPTGDRIAGAVDDAVEDAAVALLEADGAGGPFEPILVKTSASGPRVFVHYTESAPGSPATALHLGRHLRAAGFRVEERGVEFPISEHSIRYFFDSDRDEAEAVSAQLDGEIPGGAEVPILDFTGFEPKPQEGHLEVWLGR